MNLKNLKTAQNVGTTVGILSVSFAKLTDRTKSLPKKVINGFYAGGLGCLLISVSPSVYKIVAETNLNDHVAAKIVKVAQPRIGVQEKEVTQNGL